MTTFTVGKSSPNKSEIKNASLAMKSKQQVNNEVNKRRTLLQDNSWIKKRPEEENTDENYGRVVLNQYKSQDGLHRNMDEKNDEKGLLSRYRSDTTLDRISGKSDADKANKFPSLDSRKSSSHKPDILVNTGNVTSPVKKKRQSWMPPSVSNQKPDAENAEQLKRNSWAPPSTATAVATNSKQASAASDKSGGPKMIIYSSEPITSPKSSTAANIQTKTRNQQLDNVIDVKVAGKKNDHRNQQLDNLIDVKVAGKKNDHKNQQLDNLIDVKGSGKKNNHGNQQLESLIDVKVAGKKNDHRNQQLDNLIDVKVAGKKNNHKNQQLDNLIDIKVSGNKNDHGNQQLDNLIDVKVSGNKNDHRSQQLDNLIEVKIAGKKNDQRSQDLDSLIDVKAKRDKSGQGHKDLDDLIEVNRTSNGHKMGRDLDDLIAVNNTAQKDRRSQNFDDLIIIKSPTVDQSKEQTPEQGYKSANVSTRPTSEMNSSYQVTRGSSRFPQEEFEDNIPGKSIRTVYSTSDRAIIEKELCTYCRKPLGTDTKMVLDALQISCHATCFKCEVCKEPLEGVKAGDSIWIYKNTVHCTPCYSKVKASWVY